MIVRVVVLCLVALCASELHAAKDPPAHRLPKPMLYIVTHKPVGATSYVRDRGLEKEALRAFHAVKLDPIPVAGIPDEAIAQRGEILEADALAALERQNAGWIVQIRLNDGDGGPVLSNRLRDIAINAAARVHVRGTEGIVAIANNSAAVPCASPSLEPISCRDVLVDKVLKPLVLDINRKL